MATVGQNFTKDEHANGWPETLKHWQLAALQYPYARGEAARNRLANARAGDILKACQSGELPHTVTTHIPAPAKPSAPLRSPFASAEWQSRDGFTFGGMPARIGYTATGSPPKPVTTYHVTAADFAAWLDAQGEKPSEHIAAWFESQGVNKAVAIAPSALAMVPPTEPADLVLKRIALVEKNCHKWPAIEADLSEASRNGLDAARVKHGHWNERIALEWADRNGKIRRPSPMSNLAGTICRIKG